MIVKKNEPLCNYTTFKMGGIAKELYLPESTKELQELIEKCPDCQNYIISGGSNLLINDSRTFEYVLCLRNFNQTIVNEGNGRFYLGASLRIQKAIQSVNKEGFGGMEFLYSLPALIGGAIYMNAGTGIHKDKNSISVYFSIADYIESVEVLYEGERKLITKSDCIFGYRSSVFRTMKGCIIIGAHFKFDQMTQREAMDRIKQRLEQCRRHQDMTMPNFGSVFCEYNRYIVRLLRTLKLGKEDGCHFSGKTNNWMLRGESGTFDEAVQLIHRVESMHEVFGKKCRHEVIIWS